MPYRRTERVEARLADNRQRILRAARQLIGDGGFREAQVVAIASAAEVATGTIYRYFPSKADLFAEVLRVICQRELDVVSAIATSGGSAAERLGAAVRAFTSRALRARRLAYAIIVEPVDPEVDQVRLEYRHAQWRAFESIIADGIATGEFPAQNTQTSASCVVGAFLEGLVRPLSEDANMDDEARRTVIDALVEFALRAVSRKEPANEQSERALSPDTRGH